MRQRRAASMFTGLGDCACEALEPRCLLSTTYYVSPAGNDSNAGTSPGAAWKTVAKVNATTFSPGDEILFQRGGQWDEELDITESGTADQPIVFGAYGDPTQPKPEMVGSNLLTDSAFTIYSGNTYIYSSSVPLYWIYLNHGFTRNAVDATNSSTASTDLSFVESTAGSFYFNPTTSKLYLNLGTPITNQLLTATERDPGVYVDMASYITVEDLATTETAHDQAGYGFSVFGGTNVTLMNCDATLAGKHHFIAVDTTNFVGEDLLAEGAAPDQGLGGASGYVTYDDNNTALAGAPSPVNSWINDTFISQFNGTGGGLYNAFISHGSANTTADILIQNMQAPDSAEGIDVQSVGPDEQVQVIGGFLGNGAAMEIDTDNSYVNGMTFNGTYSEVLIVGQDDVVQNCVFQDAVPSPRAGHYGALVDDGTNNTFRFNTVSIESGQGPALCIENSQSNTTVYGNIFTADNAAILLDFAGSAGELNEDYNVFVSDAHFSIGSLSGSVANYTIAQWQAMGHDQHSVFADPQFVDPTNDDFELQSTSPAINLYSGAVDNSLVSAATDYYGNPRPVGSACDAGAIQLEAAAPSSLVIDATDSSMSIQLKEIAASSPDLSPMLGVWEDSVTPGTANPTLEIPLNQISSISVAAGGTQTQQLIVDFSAGSFTISGGISYGGDSAASTSTQLVGSGGSDTVSLLSSEVKFDALAISLSQTSAVTLAINSGSATLAYSSATSNLPNLSVVDDGSFTVAAAPSGSGIYAANLAGLTIGAGDVATIATPADAADRTVLELGSLAIGSGASLNVQSNDVILHNGSASQVAAWLTSGFAHGAWNGTGIRSATAAGDASQVHAVGYLLNAAGGKLLDSTFDNQAVSTTDVLIKYTVYGDANLDGAVNAADYAWIDNGFNLHLTGWLNGDFNYDGVVNGDDYSLIDNSFNMTTAIASEDLVATPAVERVATPVASTDTGSAVAAANRATPAVATSWLAGAAAPALFGGTPIQSVWEVLQRELRTRWGNMGGTTVP